MIDILVPVLGRPESIAPLVENVHTATTVAHELLFLCSDNDDPKVLEQVRKSGERSVIARFPSSGQYARKMNHGYCVTGNPWLLLAAQDVRFHPGWDTKALRCAESSGCRVIGTNDLGNPESFRRGRFSTHPLVARSYADELGTVDGPGALVSEAYDHNWVDRELAGTAISRREWYFCRDSVVEHLHPHWGKGEMDATYRKGLERFAADRAIYNRRRRLWVGK